jgi:histidinol-phosphate aminotransferase
MKVSEEILKMIPYKPGKPISETQREYGLTDVVKLASNENPLGMSPKAKGAVLGAVDQSYRYPDASCYALVQRLSDLWGAPKNTIAIGNGSDELIDFLVRIYCLPGDGILTSEAAFVAYSVRASASRVQTYRTPLMSGYKADLKKMSQFLKENQEAKRIRLVFIPNPNNPTGTYHSDAEIAEFLKEWGGSDDVLIVFDEAYTEFVRAKDYQSTAKYLATYKNVVVLKTLSKIYGLAGFRVGVLLGPADTVEIINRVRTPFNVNELAQVAALAAIDDKDFVKKTCEVTWAGLDYFYQELKSLGLPFTESQGNFVMFDTKRDAKLVDQALLKRGIIMRPLLNYGFPTELRLSVGLAEENRKAMAALKDVLKEIPAIKN